MRLIDADKLLVSDEDCFGKCRDCNNNVINCTELADLVNAAQTIDAVEVVRCKNCAYQIKRWNGVKCCEAHGDHIGADYDFCSNGRRKNDEID